jgi:thymidine phosphorylase
VLDVKFGSGAFMKTRAEAEALAAALTAVGREMGVQTAHLLTPMDQPLGHTVRQRAGGRRSSRNAARTRAA